MKKKVTKKLSGTIKMKDTMGMITDGGSSARVHSPLGEMGEKLVNTYGKEKDGQKKMADEYLNKELRLGDKWYLINSAWFQKWKAFVGLDSSLSARDRSSLGPLDKICNSSLLTTNGQSLREDLTEGNDYFTICEELWSYLVKIYSISSPKVRLTLYLLLLATILYGVCIVVVVAERMLLSAS